MSDKRALARDQFVNWRAEAVAAFKRRPGKMVNAYAQVTARCRQQNQHAYALYLQLEETCIADICYSKGSSKFSMGIASVPVETAVALFCAYAKGKEISKVSNVSLAQLAEYFGIYPLIAQSRNDEPLLSLYIGGSIPFTLFRWSLLNNAVKRAVGRVLGIAPDAQVFLRDVTQVHALVRELSTLPAFRNNTRVIELAVRAMHMNTVDESNLRTIYQRATQNELLEEAAHRGFAREFN